LALGVFIAFCVVGTIYEQIRWSQLPIIEQKARLHSCSYMPPSKYCWTTYTTIWNCGPYGRVVCENEQVFKEAKDESILLIKVWDKDVLIVGIRHD